MNENRFGGMATCKHTGRPLPLNLYNDNKGRKNRYRYRQEDGSYTPVNLPYTRAVAAAKRANAKRQAPDGSLVFWIEQYRLWQIDRDPSLKPKRGWRDRHRQLERFGEHWNVLKPSLLTVSTLSDWWDELTYDQQHNRRAYFSKFFQWAMGKGVVRSNPFTKYDNVARLADKRKPTKQRPALSLPEFHAIYEHAPAHLRTAMLISLATTMREGDIVALRWDDIEDGYLQKTISKSLNQRGAAAAAHLKWKLSEHPLLKRAIDEARERRMAKGHRCPYIVARPRHRKRAPSARITHPMQCLPEHISRGFKKAREAAFIQGTTFHEIRGLSITLLLENGMDIAAVSKLAAHVTTAQTSSYTAGQAPVFIDMAGMVVEGTMP